MSSSPADDLEDFDLEDDFEAFETRADYIAENDLPNVTSRGDWFDAIHKALLSPKVAVIVGPRGCGKTHMMRYTWLHCRETARSRLRSTSHSTVICGSSLGCSAALMPGVCSMLGSSR